MIDLCCRTKKTTDMHDVLVTNRDAEKLSAGVAKDAINRYNARRKSDNVSLSYLYLIVPNFNNVHKRKVFFFFILFSLKWSFNWEALTIGRDRSKCGEVGV